MQHQVSDFVINNFQLILCLITTVLAIAFSPNFIKSFFSLTLLLVVGVGSLTECALLAFNDLHPVALNPAFRSSFEFHLALSYLALGICGISAFFANWFYRLAVVIFTTIFYWGHAFNQLSLLYGAGSITPANDILDIWVNLLVPLILLLLLPFTYPSKRQDIIYF
jgi:hypothetical protein